MRIDELTIQNFKGFENETFHFNPHFNVIIGKNGSGKTSLLDALTYALNCYLIGIDEKFIMHLEVNDVRIAIINGQPKPQLPVRINGKGFLHNKEITFNPELQKTPVGSKLTSYGGQDGAIEDIARYDVQRSRNLLSDVLFPFVGFYGTGRLWKNKGNVNYFKQQEGVFSGYEDCFSGNSSNEVFLSWYKTYEDEVSKFRQPIDELFLELFRKTISSIVPEWDDMAYSFKEDDLMGIFKDENGNANKLPFKNLSDGYRNVIGMVADMVYRCIQLNPGLKERAVVDTEGVVLIDEIDLHLHPEWQRTIVGDLKRVFPKIQFIATTHSPFIIQSVSKDELIILDKGVTTDKDPWRQSIEEIAEVEMQVTNVRRSELFKERESIAKEYFTLVKQNDTKGALREKINEAKKQLDQYSLEFSDDPAYVAMLRAQLEKTETHASRIENE